MDEGKTREQLVKETKALREQMVKLEHSNSELSILSSNAIEKLQAIIATEKLKMESMVEIMVEAAIMIDDREGIMVLNSRARRMLGFRVDEEVTNEKMRAVNLDKAFQKCREKKNLVTMEITVPTDEGLVLYAEINPAKDKNGEIIGIIAVLRDVTREKQIDRMKSEFVSTVSHELRTPIIGIGGAINNILMGTAGKINDKLKNYLLMAKRDIKRLDRLISDLLDYSQIGRGLLRIQRSKVDICVVAQNAARILNSQIKSKKLKISSRFCKKSLYCYIDRDKITQVFTNLLHNAVKFTPDRGNIQIIIEHKGEKKLVEVAIVDSGIGIAREDIPKLFQRFSQIGRIDGAGTKGTGLGLAICKGIIEAHKGGIWVESALHKGSKFVFTLPEFDAEKIFVDCLDDSLQKAKDTQSTMLLILIDILNFNEIKKLFGAGKTEDILSELEEAAGKILRGRTDLAVRYKENKIAFSLNGAGREDVKMLVDRLTKAVISRFLDLVKAKKIPESVKITFGAAAYPDEAMSPKELIEKASEVYRQETVVEHL
ncbi:MAG: diguanylate cyclase [Candidatus Aureabacteria bacterium]|nr:diguanylate cyclase [Candidatus Auribacterota bacterium]